MNTKDIETEVNYCKEFKKHFKILLHLFPSFNNSTPETTPSMLW